ncbi:putative ribonuclease H-like domain-containing protein [Tanacetum coccineum]
MKKMYCLVVTDDYSRFSWVFFLATKDETSGILKSFITRVENLIDQKVKVIRCDNGTEFKNKEMNQFCERKGIKREFSIARTPQQNRVAERKNRTLIEAARTMLADFKLPTTFWAEAVNTACYVQNRFCENMPNIAGSGPNYLFDIDALTKSMNYKPVFTKNQSNGNAGTKAYLDAGKARMETVDEDLRKDSKSIDQEKDDNVNSNNNVNPTSTNVVNVVAGKTSIELPDDLNMPALEDTVYLDDDEDVGAEADMNNLDASMPVSLIPTTRVHKDHPVEQIIRDLNSVPQIRRMTKNLEEHEPKKVIHALKDTSWIEAMQEELLELKLQEVWTLVELPNGKRTISTKWVFRNKKDKRGILIKNKARLVAQGYTQEEGIDDDEVFAPVARIKAIRLFLAYASFKDFVVYQMDVKSAFLYGKIEEEVYDYQPSGFEDPDFPDRVYKVEKALYGLHQSPKAWYETLSTYLLDNGFQRGKIDKTLFIKRDKGDILLVQVYVDDMIFGSTKKELCNAFEKLMHENQDKYVAEILKKFGFTKVKTASTPMETQKPLLKDEDGEEVDVHLYRSMIGSLMYLTSSRPDIMFAGLWYPKDSPFDLVAYTDSDYAGASLDRKSTIGVQLQALMDGKKIIITESTMRRDLQLEDAEGVDCLPNATIFKQLTLMGKNTEVPQPSGSTDNVVDEVIYKELDDSLVRAATTASSLEAEQDSGVNTPRSDEDSMKLKELMEFYTKMQQRVLDLENTKTAQAQEITSLKLRLVWVIRRMHPNKGGKLRTLIKMQRLHWLMKLRGGVPDSKKDDVVSTAGVAITISAATTTVPITPKEITLAQALEELKRAKPKDKGKGKMVELEKPMKKKQLIRLDEEIALKLQAEFDEEVRLARKKAEKEQEANVALTKEWDNVQAMIDADYQMAQQMQVEEQENLSIEEKSKLFVQLLKTRKKHFAAMRGQEKRNKPPTKAQKRKTISIYLKNMAGYQHNQLKNKSFNDIQKLFDKAMKRVNTFVDIDAELVEGSEVIAECSKTRAEGSSKRAGEDL